MDIKEMHVWFRQYAQQMGMQNVRAILPEQIDIVINTSISDTLNEVIRTNVALTNDRVVTDNSKIGQINALRTLIRSTEVDLAADFTDRPAYSKPLNCLTLSPFFTSNGKITDCAYLIDLAVQYGIHSELYLYNDLDNYQVRPNKLSDSIKTSYYPIRIIETRFLADTLQDFVLRPRLRSPIAIVNGLANNSDGITNDKLDIYFGEDLKKPNIISSQVYPAIILVNYIAKPAKVQYASDFGGEDINCDLPETMHVDILKHAVDLYRVAIQGSLYANQQQQQAQQREVGRNNVRPDNEGYTQ